MVLSANIRNMAIKNSFLRNIIVVASGTAGAQLLTFSYSPILTRIYTPEIFGLLGSFIAIFTIISPITTLSYPMAIVLPSKDSDAIGLMKLSFLISFFWSIVTLLIISAISSSGLNIGSLEDIQGFLYLLPLLILFSSTLAIISNWMIRKREFKIKAKGAILQSLVFNTSKVLGGIISPSAIMLVTITASANLLHSLILYKLQTTTPNPRHIITHNSNLLYLLKKYKDFAIYRAPQVFLTNLGENFPVLILAWLFGPSTSGYYALSRMVLLVPSTLLGQSVADVFYSKYVEEINANRNGNKVLLYSCSILLLLGLVPYLVIYLYGPILFSITFGPEWVEAGEYAKWISLWLIASLVSKPISFAVPVLSLQKLYLKFEVITMIVRFLCMYIGYLIWESALGSIIMFSLSSMACYILLIFFIIYRQSNACGNNVSK